MSLQRRLPCEHTASLAAGLSNMSAATSERRLCSCDSDCCFGGIQKPAPENHVLARLLKQNQRQHGRLLAVYVIANDKPASVNSAS